MVSSSALYGEIIRWLVYPNVNTHNYKYYNFNLFKILSLEVICLILKEHLEV